MRIAFANEKGGVAKTTLTLQVGAVLAERGHRVLLVDLDGQAHLTRSFGVELDQLEHTSYDAIQDVDQLLDPESLVIKLKQERLSLLPGDPTLLKLESELRNDNTGRIWQFSLQDYLGRLKQRYDYTLIDCPPHRGVLTIMALTAADRVVVPVQPEKNSLEGLLAFEQQVKEIRKRTNPVLEFRLIPTLYRRCRAHEEALEILRQDYAEVLFPVVIPSAVGFHDSSAQGISLIHLDPHSKGAQALEQLVKEIESLWPTTSPSA